MKTIYGIKQNGRQLRSTFATKELAKESIDKAFPNEGKWKDDYFEHGSVFLTIIPMELHDETIDWLYSSLIF